MARRLRNLACSRPQAYPTFIAICSLLVQIATQKYGYQNNVHICRVKGEPRPETDHGSYAVFIWS